MKLKITFIAFILSVFLFGQEKPQPLKSGTLIFKNNEKVQFSNLRYEDDKVYYINILNQQNENAYTTSIASIEEGVRFSENEAKVILEIESEEEKAALVDGVYVRFEDLVGFRSVSKDYTLTNKNIDKGYYYLVDQNNKKVGNVFAIVKDGELYIRGSEIKKHLANHKALSFSRSGYIFVKMTKREDQYHAYIPFSNDAIIWIGAGFSGGIAGALLPGIGQALVAAAGSTAIIALIATSKKQVILDMTEKSIYLNK